MASTLIPASTDIVMENHIKYVLMILMVTLWSSVMPSHYRGGTIKWAVSPSNPNQLIISWRVSWRRSYVPASGFKCLNRGELLTGEGFLLCQQCISKYITSMQFNCTDFSDAGESTAEDWTTGIGSYEYTFEKVKFNMTFRFDDRMQTYQGSNWIALENFGQANYYKMVSSVDLTVRVDTGRPNTSPATTMLPIIRVQANCTSNIRIPTLDADNDVVRCRWADALDESIDSECPPSSAYGQKVCGPITPDSVIDEDRCVITFPATIKPGWYGVAVTIEDFIDKASATPLSKIPLQFLIYVYPSDRPCDEIQVISPLCELVKPNHQFKANITAFSENGTRIESIETVTPLGMTRSNLTQSQNDPSKYYIELYWTPTYEREETVCYYASDVNGVSSKQGCFKIVVTDSPQNVNGQPEPDPNKSHPRTSEFVSPTLQEWSIYYPMMVQRPLLSKKIYIKSLTGDVLAAVDISEEEQVLFNQTEDGGTRLVFSTPGIQMPDMQVLFVEVEQGAVVGPPSGPCAQDLGSIGGKWLFRTNSSLDAPVEPTIVCDHDQMSVFIPRTYAGNIGARKFTLHDPACRGIVHNETHYLVKTRFDECGSVLKKKNGILFVRNTVRDKIRPFTNGASVSRRKHKFQINAVCKSKVIYNADIQLDPDSVENSATVQGTFDVAASMVLFTDDSYEEPYIGNELSDINLDQRLYVAVLANQADVSLRVETCKAYAKDTHGGNGSYREYKFLENGCVIDNTMRFEEFVNVPPNEKRFSIDAFTFLFTGMKDYMTMKCTVSICIQDNPDACIQQCVAMVGNNGDSGRRRRNSPHPTQVYLI